MSSPLARKLYRVGCDSELGPLARAGQAGGRASGRVERGGRSFLSWGSSAKESQPEAPSLLATPRRSRGAQCSGLRFVRGGNGGGRLALSTGLQRPHRGVQPN